MKTLRHSFHKHVGLIRCFLFLLSLSAAMGQTVGPISVRDSALPPAPGANGDSTGPTLSPNGRWVLFTSSANNLAPGDNAQPGADVYLYDRASNSVVLVSVNWSGSGGGNGHSIATGLSVDGRFALFESDSSDLVPSDTNNASDVFIRDLLTGQTILVSAGLDGAVSTGDSMQSVLSTNGQFVSFVSTGRNLVEGDTNVYRDVFLRDVAAGVTRWVSAGGNSPSTVSSISMTPDGRFVAFATTATGIVDHVTGGTSQVYVRDLLMSQTYWISSNAASIAATYFGATNLPSMHPVISDDGAIVVFRTGLPNGTNNAVILRHNLAAGTSMVVTASVFAGWPHHDNGYRAEITPDGRFIAYVISDPEGGSSVWLLDVQTGDEFRVSANLDGEVSPGSISHTPVLSVDGRFVAFLSNATNLTATIVSNGFHIYLRDTTAGITTLIDRDLDGTATGSITRIIPALSSDANWLAFSAQDGRLVESDTNNATDVFLADTTTGMISLVSRRDPSLSSQTGNGLSPLGNASISADGRWVAFASYASDLVPDDTNRTSDVFVRDLWMGTTELVSRATNGSVALGPYSGSPMITSDGRFVVFVSSATNLVSSPAANGYLQVYVRDLIAGTNMMVIPTGTSLPAADSSAPVISPDGRYVVFTRGPSGGVLILRDLTSPVLQQLSSNVSETNSVSFSDNARVAYSSGSQVHVRDLQMGTTVYSASGSMSAGSLSSDGNRLLYRDPAGAITAVDLVGNTNLAVLASGVPLRGSRLWSSDGRFFVLASRFDLLPQDANGTNDVYLVDLLTQQLTLVSANSNSTTSANGSADSPAISGDGRFVAYRSFASDAVTPDAGPGPHILLFNRWDGSTSRVMASQDGAFSGPSAISRPLLSADGSIIAFDSWWGGPAEGDFNRARDSFYSAIAATIDSDADGIPDVWMIQHFEHATGQPGDKSLPEDDADDDGMSNREEYMAGTIPTDRGSVLRLQISVSAVTQGARLTWPVTPGRAYRVQYVEALSNPEWLDLATLPGSGPEGEFVISPDEEERYFRVQAVP